jgi:hypothetical protein
MERFLCEVKESSGSEEFSALDRRDAGSPATSSDFSRSFRTSLSVTEFLSGVAQAGQWPPSSLIARSCWT